MVYVDQNIRDENDNEDVVDNAPVENLIKLFLNHFFLLGVRLFDLLPYLRVILAGLRGLGEHFLARVFLGDVGVDQMGAYSLVWILKVRATAGLRTAGGDLLVQTLLHLLELILVLGVGGVKSLDP